MNEKLLANKSSQAWSVRADYSTEDEDEDENAKLE